MTALLASLRPSARSGSTRVSAFLSCKILQVLASSGNDGPLDLAVCDKRGETAVAKPHTNLAGPPAPKVLAAWALHASGGRAPEPL